MTVRAFASSLVALLCGALIVHAQMVQVPGTALPGPAAPRPPSAAAPPRDGAAASAVTGTGRIRGRVLSADSGNPLRRAQVRLAGVQPGPQVSQVATTDADGRYQFTNLPASRYTLVVTRSGYINLEFGQQRPFERGKPLTLADGETADKIDFSLPRGGVITGKVTDDTGEPVPGVRMQAERYQYMPGGQRRLVPGNTGPFMQAVTDDLGQFRVYGLMPGSYILSAVPAMNGSLMVAGPNMVMSSSVSGAPEPDGFTTTYFPGTSNVEEAQTITVGLGQEAPAFFSIVSARMSRVSGFIRTSQGARVTGRAMVSLRTPMGLGGFSTNGMATINADGSFSIANVPPGEHFIDVRPMMMMMGPQAPGTTPQAGDQEFASVPITVSGQDINGLVITTGPGATVSGRVSFEGNSPRPQTPQPLRVNVAPADVSMQMMPMTAALMDNGVVDENGRFQLRGVNGQVLFRMGAQGWNLKSVTLDGVDITDTAYEAKPSTNVTGLEITMTDRQTSLSGVVRNTRDDLVKDFVVAIFPSQLRDGMITTRFTRTVRPDQDGKYVVRGLPPGDYFAVAVESIDQGGEWDPAFQQEMRPRGKAFRLSDAQLLTLDLTLTQ